MTRLDFGTNINTPIPIMFKNVRFLTAGLFVITILPAPVVASERQLQECYLEQINKSGPGVSVGDVREVCEYLSKLKPGNDEGLTALDMRILGERRTQHDQNVITPHKRNYILPLTYAFSPDSDPFLNSPNGDELEHVEAIFQISFKAPIYEGIFSKDRDSLYFGFTLQSFWQTYNLSQSSPFRETNYQPEFMYARLNDWSLGSWNNKVLVFGLEHQSNGQTELISRSWNRLYILALWEKGNTVLSLKPWFRLPERDKEYPTDPLGNENPDIHEYMGHFEFSAVKRWGRQTFDVMLRNNLRTENKGAIELGWTFPLGGRFKGYAQCFSGYGESLIDYNTSVTRLGLGILLTDFF